MHAYKDAIRRTAGAYVIYPGDESEVPYKEKGFHELIPGLGAFAIRPSRINKGSEALEKFLNEVVDHFLNRASQREKFSFDTYKTFKDKPRNEIREKLPEPYGNNRGLIPGDTNVLIGYYKNPNHLEWIKKNKKYNIRTGGAIGARNITGKEAGAKYLLLYGSTTTEAELFYKLSFDGPKILTKTDLRKLSYPHPRNDAYLVFDLADLIEDEFKGMKWKFKKLEKYYEDEKGAPFVVSLAELMMTLVK